MTSPPDAALSTTEQTIVDAAWTARAQAVCPFSGFAVGAAVLDDRGQCFTGANVENASYNLGLCAERVALYYAITHGCERICTMAITTEAATLTVPCGACRQALWEFAPDVKILLVNREHSRRTSIAQLLPDAFDRAALRGE